MNFVFTNFYSFDYILLAITLIFIFFSIWKGFIQSILGLMTWVGSILITLIFYKKFANYLSTKINQIAFLESLGLSEIIGILISIPVIFIFSLILLRKLRKIISSDLDKATLGIILDKLFGTIYGVIFSYFIFSILLFFIEQVNLNFILFLTDHSYILSNINTINQLYIYQHIPFLLKTTVP